MNKFTINFGNYLVKHKKIYYILNFTWGLPMTILGFIIIFLLLPFKKTKLKSFNNILYIKIKTKFTFGFSIGCIFVVSCHADKEMKSHEYGHTVQNAIFGPFMPFLVYLPSFIRFWIRHFKRKNNPKIKLSPYNNVWFENTASGIGLYYLELCYWERIRNVNALLKNET